MPWWQWAVNLATLYTPSSSLSWAGLPPCRGLVPTRQLLKWFKREGTYVFLWLIHVDKWQKPTKHGKAIILQLKINFRKPYTVQESDVVLSNISINEIIFSPIKIFLSIPLSSVQFSHSVVSDSAISWIAACQASLSITNSQSSLKVMSIELVMPSNHPILCRPLLLLPPISPSIRVFSNESALHMRWPKYQL